LYPTIDTSNDFDITVTAQMATATDYVILEYVNILAIEG
jgi:hypothetical protein